MLNCVKRTAPPINKREADRIKAVIALATGWSAEVVAEVLQVDPNTVRNHIKCYRAGGLEGLGRTGESVGGSAGLLIAKQLTALDAHLQAKLCLSAKAIAHWVKETFGVSYTEHGMTAVLHQLGYTCIRSPGWCPARPTGKPKNSSSKPLTLSRTPRVRMI